MRYMLLLYGDEIETGKHDEEDMPKWFAFTEKLQAAGKMLGGEALQPTQTATSIRLKGDTPISLDGPFAETKEALGGFYMIEAKDLDEAVEWAKQVPNIPRGGTVEIRPIMEFDMDQ
ncbi:MAG: YciI family protein [bacterium]|nr:YciI family protein [bacterium]